VEAALVVRLLMPELMLEIQELAPAVAQPRTPTAEVSIQRSATLRRLPVRKTTAALRSTASFPALDVTLAALRSMAPTRTPARTRVVPSVRC